MGFGEGKANKVDLQIVKSSSEEVRVYEENENRRICEHTWCIGPNCPSYGKEGEGTSCKTSIWSSILHRAELERSSRPELDISERYGYIYATRNIKSGCMYIGQKMSKEFIEDYYGSGKVFKLLKECYGGKYVSSIMETRLLEWCSSAEDLNKREIYWIGLYEMPNYRDSLFYNISWGGQTSVLKGKNNPFYGKTHDEDTRKKISDKVLKAFERYTDDDKAEWNRHRIESWYSKPEEVLKQRRELFSKVQKEVNKDPEVRKKKGNFGSSNPNYGKHLSEETKHKLSESHKGRYDGDKNPFYGKHHTDETKRILREKNSGPRWSEEDKRKMSESRKGRKMPKGFGNKVRERLVGHEVSKETRMKISEARKGKLLGIPKSEETRRRMSESAKGKPHGHGKKVLCVTDNIIFRSIGDAVKYAGVSRYMFLKDLRDDNICEINGKYYKFIKESYGGEY